MENIVFYPFILFMSMVFLGFLKVLKQPHKNPKTFPLPPGPKPWPIIGCFPTLLHNKPFFRFIHKFMRESNNEISCIRLGSVHVIVVTCPEISCQLLKEKDSIFASRPLTKPAEVVTSGYSTTIFVPFGEHWKKMKRIIISEMLSPAKHKLFYDRRLQEADHLVRYLYNKSISSDDGCLVNVRYVSQHYCANLIKNMLFSKRSFGNGGKDGGPSFEDEEHVNAVFSLLNHIYAFSVSDYFPFLLGFDFDGHQKIVNEANGTVRKYQDPIIKERYQQWSTGTKKKVEDLLDMFINFKDDKGVPLLSKTQIQAQITEIMLATIDNPANAVEWALAEMINQPNILAKAMEELDEIVGKERLVQESDLPQLNYITACIREAFRLHPVVPFNVAHTSMADTTIGKYLVPKGSHVLLSRMGLGRNPKVWDEPEKFMPERHLGKEGCSQVTLRESELRFISFSTGMRGCPGITLGTSITLMLFARLLQGFSWSAPCTQTRIDLTESEDALTLAKSLVALATPRLPAHLYLP